MICLDKPTVTFVILAYNQSRYIAETIRSALAQTYTPLEIIISDDCSTDSTFQIMQSAVADYHGPHKIILNQNKQNLNIGDHVNTIASIATGEFLVLAGGDDVSLPSRSEELFNEWVALGCPPAVLFSDFIPIDVNSNIVQHLNENIYRGCFCIEKMAAGELRVLGATTAISKNLLSSFFPLLSTVVHEDRVFPFRAIIMDGVVKLVDKKLVKYRIEGGISRYKAPSGTLLLRTFLPKTWLRTLPDANQRLVDLLTLSPNNTAMINECKKTIIDHHAWIALSKARGLGIEICAIKWLSQGARPVALFRLYLKLRFIILFNCQHARAPRKSNLSCR